MSVYVNLWLLSMLPAVYERVCVGRCTCRSVAMLMGSFL